jgi:6-phosphogluconolactonase
MRVYVGTYTYGKSEGIYVGRLDLASGALEQVAKAAEVENPSFLALDPQHRYLYAVNELGQFGGKASGGVTAFAISPATGELAYLNQQPSLGAYPCHLTVDATGKYVLVANYGGGSVAALPVEDDGRLGPATALVQHEGSSVHPTRQTGPHAHSVTLEARNRYAFVADLGLDKLLIYGFDSAQGRLAPNVVPWFQTKPGAGPRHLDIHPSGRYAYLINELDSTLTALACDGERGAFTEIHTVSTLPPGFEGQTTCADVHVAPSGKFVYGSNRGHDSIAIFAIDEATGRLTPAGYQPTLGKNPRNFAIDPTGTFLLAANQDSDTVVTFRLDPDSGRLTPTGHVAEVATPVCLKVIPWGD